ncbi:MAG: cytochrome C oxidase subunit IV family protein [Desulfurococcales archaeon]|nr:cytochrome C oxidase subunit IV family protein [Desulfurococcales archaeon]
MGREPVLYVSGWTALVVTAFLEVFLIMNGIVRNTLAFTISIAMIQSTIIAYIYQHLKYEESSVKMLPLTSFLMLLVLVSAAITSVLACTPYLG